MKPLRVAAYGRVSTLNQVREHDSSVDSQMERIRQRATYESSQAVHSDARPWQVVAEYREEGRSGKDTDRPELQRLLADVRDRKIDLVCVTKIDRITRSLVDFYDLWNVFEQHDVSFIALDDNFETKSAAGRAMLKITLVFAELERERTSERTREKVELRRNAGLWFGGQVPFGYRVHPTNKTALEIHDADAEVVRREVFEKFLELGTTRAVVRHLNNRGIKRPKRTTRKGTVTGGSDFTVQGVLKMLSNHAYVAKRKLDDGEFVDCNWPPLLDAQLFDRVQALLAKNSMDRPSGRTPLNHVFLLEGLLRCGGCGSMLICSAGTGRNQTYYYYRCSKKQHTAGTKCKTRDVPVAAVEQFVLDQLRSYAIDNSAILEAVRTANAGRDDALARVVADIAQAKLAHTKAKQTVGRFLDAIGEGDGEVSAILSRLKEAEAKEQVLRQEVLDLEAKRDALEQQILSAEVVAEGYRSLHHLLAEAMQVGAEKEVQSLLQAVIDVVEWRQSAEDPKKGEALIQLFELPEGFLVDEARKKDSPVNHLESGSLGCQLWLRGEDSNLGPGD